MHTVALAPIGPAQLLRRVDDCDVIYIPWPMTPPTTAPPTTPTGLPPVRTAPPPQRRRRHRSWYTPPGRTARLLLPHSLLNFCILFIWNTSVLNIRRQGTTCPADYLS